MLKTLGLHLDTSVVGAVRILSLYLTSWQNHCYTELEPIPSVRDNHFAIRAVLHGRQPARP